MGVLTTPSIVEFEQYRLDQFGGKLLRTAESGVFEPVSLGSRAFAILCTLVARAGDIVSKNDIMASVWPDTAVEEANLTVQISALRPVLDQGRGGGSCHQTVIGRGYRFLPAIMRVSETTLETSDQRSRPGHRIKESIDGAFPPAALLARGGWGTSQPSALPSRSAATKPARASDRRQSIMIMPFENSGPDARQDDLAR